MRSPHAEVEHRDSAEVHRHLTQEPAMILDVVSLCFGQTLWWSMPWALLGLVRAGRRRGRGYRKLTE